MSRKMQRLNIIVLALIFIIVLIVGLVAFILFYEERKKDPTDNGQMQQYQSLNYKLRTRKREVERKINDLTAQYEKLTVGETTVMLCVNYAGTDLYEVAYPLLKGYNAMFVVSEGAMPGDEGCINAMQYTEMVQNGWQPLLGGYCPTNAESLDQWRKTLQKQLNDLRGQGLAVPTAYYFFTGCEDEFIPQVMAVLSQNGINACNWPISGYVKIMNFTEQSVMVAPSYPIVESGQSNASYILMTLQEGDAVVVSTRNVSHTVLDDTQDVSVEKYTLMLDYLKENSLDSAVKTFEQLHDYREKIANDEQATAILAQIKQLQKDLDQIDQEILDSVTALQ